MVGRHTTTERHPKLKLYSFDCLILHYRDFALTKKSERLNGKEVEPEDSGGALTIRGLEAVWAASGRDGD